MVVFVSAAIGLCNKQASSEFVSWLTDHHFSLMEEAMVDHRLDISDVYFNEDGFIFVTYEYIPLEDRYGNVVKFDEEYIPDGLPSTPDDKRVKWAGNIHNANLRFFLRHLDHTRLEEIVNDARMDDARMDGARMDYAELP